MPIGLVTAPLRMAAAGTRMALNATAAAAGVARHTSSTGASRIVGADATAEGSPDRYANRAGAVGIGASAALGAMTGNLGTAGAAGQRLASSVQHSPTSGTGIGRTTKCPVA